MINESYLQPPKYMVMEAPRIISNINGLYSIIKYGLENTKDGFVLNFLPSKYLTYFYSEKYANAIMKNLATIHTSGMIHYNYGNTLGQD